MLRSVLACSRWSASRSASGRSRSCVEGHRLRSLPVAAEPPLIVLAYVATHSLQTAATTTSASSSRSKEWCEGGDVDALALRWYLLEQGLGIGDGGTYRLGSDGPEPSLASASRATASRAQRAVGRDSCNRSGRCCR